MPYNNNFNNNSNYNNRGFNNQNGGGNRYNNGGGNRQNYTRNAPSADSTNTDGNLLMNQRAGKFMKIKFWNRCLGLDIGTFNPGEEMDTNMMKNVQTFGHVFAFNTLYELLEICEEVQESLKKSNTFESTATVAGQKKDAIIEISNGDNLNLSKGIYLVLYKNVDPGKRTNTYDYYPFGASTILRGYNHTTGSAKEDIHMMGDFKKFTAIVKESVKAFTMAQAHAAKDAGKSDRMSTFNALAAIAAGLGVDMTKTLNASQRTNGKTSYNRGGGNGNYQSGFQKQNPNQYQRKSQGGQWGQNAGGYGNQGGPSGQSSTPPWESTTTPIEMMTNDPVDIQVDMSKLENVDLSKFA